MLAGVLMAPQSSVGASLVAVRGCYEHGGAGTFCIDLDACTADPRSSFEWSLVVDLDSAPSGDVDYTITCGSEFSDSGTAVLSGPTQVTIELGPPWLPSRGCCTLSLSGGAQGNTLIRTLVADVDQSGRVTYADEEAVESHLDEPVDGTNFWYDINADGWVDYHDARAISQYRGNQSPDCGSCGACCLGGSDCVLATEDQCITVLGGTFLGVEADCPTQTIDVEIEEPGGSIFIHTIEVPADCADTPGLRSDCVPGTPIDAWKSPESASMCHSFNDPDSPPIPADFFGPGSDPFSDPICLRGLPLGPTPHGDFGQADTLVQRSADPFDVCDFPGGGPVAVDIEIVALSLEGVAPITVTYNGGQSPEQWDVTVDLSEVHTDGDPGNDPPIGTLTATKEHCNGGTYTSVLHVQPRFTFTKVGEPGEVRVLDRGLEGESPVVLDASSTPQNWVSVPDARLNLVNPICTDFHPGLTDGQVMPTCDCNGNSTHDSCDIEGGTSGDCNANTIPDECDISWGTSQDVDTDGIPDECAVAQVPAASRSGIILLVLLLVLSGVVLVERRRRTAA
jgi:hypothetical protein